MTANPKLTDQQRLEAAAEVVAFAHWRLSQILDEQGAEGFLDVTTRGTNETETGWLMRMLGSAADDLLALSLPASSCPAKPLSAPHRMRRGRKAGVQTEMQFGRPRLRVIDGGRA